LRECKKTEEINYKRKIRKAKKEGDAGKEWNLETIDNSDKRKVKARVLK